MSAATKHSRTLLKFEGLALEIVRAAGGQIRELHFILPSPVARERVADASAHRTPPTARGLERFWTELASAKGKLRQLRRPCTSQQMHQAYLLWCVCQGVEQPARHDELSAFLASKPGVCRRRGSFRRKDATKRQLRCLYFDDEREPPEGFKATKLEWLSACVEAFGVEVVRLQKAGVLARPKPKSEHESGPGRSSANVRARVTR
jgi:hypothetical protein